MALHADGLRADSRVPPPGDLLLMRRFLRFVSATLGLLLACEVAEIAPPVAANDSPSQGGDVDPGDGDPPPVDAPLLGYPRLAAFVGNWENYTSADVDTMARFGLAALRAGPEAVAALSARNPDIELFFRVMPQAIPATDWGREWSWLDRMRRYAVANDWILRHHNGGEAGARGWGAYWRWGDFTSRCPEGTYFDAAEPALDSRGLTLAEWSATKLIPWFVSTKMQGYDGLWWEVVVQEPNRYWWYVDVQDEFGGLLDWDRNNLADWWEAEWTLYEAFRSDWDSVATWWMDEIRTRVGEDFPIIAGGDGYTPPLPLFHGFKNEDFLNRNRWDGPQWTWWDEFYLTSPTSPRRGYVYQRDHARAGWELSVNQIYWYDDAHWTFSNPTLMRKYVRFALGTTLLGDGYFSFYDQADPATPRNPWVSEYYDLDLGVRAAPFEKVVFGADTLYTRRFYDAEDNLSGLVTVNPQNRSVNGVPARDATIEVVDVP